MNTLICGSFAFDSIMLFRDHFKNHILPEKVHMINVSFLVPEMRREYGGCAGNIAYNLKLLGGDGLPMGTVGIDFGPYAKWMDHCGVARQYVTEVEETYTGQAYITTDMDDNQITAFHPGAMSESHRNRVPVDAGIRLGIVSPDGRDGMIQHAEQFAEAGIPFIFDPGQGMPMFNAEELIRFIDQASFITLNDYESQLMQERTRLSEKQIAERVEALIITKGGDGSLIYADGGVLQVSAAPVLEMVDPTGCGDAYRAGLLYGMEKGFDWRTTGSIASLMGAIKIEHHGTQNHRFDSEQFAERFKASFGYRL